MSLPFPRRAILHVDLDAFYSSVEQRDNPALRGKPVIVGGDPEQRGVVATASYEARKYGVHSGMSSAAAKRLCAHGVFLRPRFDAYRAVSRGVMDVLAPLSGDLERIALDEAFLDVSTLLGHTLDVTEFGLELKREISKISGLTASLGIGANKLTAKIASDHRKPDGLTIVPDGEQAAFIAPLPVRKLWGIGPVAEERLAREGISLASQLASAEQEWLVQRFGMQGLEWQNLARGIDDRAVGAEVKRRQVSREETFPQDVADRARLHAVLARMAEDIGSSLDGGSPPRTVTLKIRYGDFTTYTRQQSPGGVILPNMVGQLATSLLDDHWTGSPIRLLGIAVSNFVEKQRDQLSLFEL
ncbi:MAG TPA: DNA polymerase IV [Chloroflexota bacterium]